MKTISISHLPYFNDSIFKQMHCTERFLQEIVETEGMLPWLAPEFLGGEPQKRHIEDLKRGDRVTTFQPLAHIGIHGVANSDHSLMLWCINDELEDVKRVQQID